MLDKDLIMSLQSLSSSIKQTCSDLPNVARLRKMLETRGVFKNPHRMGEDELKSTVKQRPLAAVDGSRIEYGSFFPYYIVLMRSLACSTKSEDIGSSEILTPLNEELYRQLEENAAQNHIGMEEAYRNHLKNALAQLELRSALQAARQWKPYLLMLDGGFLLFDKFPEWAELTEVCRQKDIILVGIIEEIATAEISKWFDIAVGGRPRIYDRELLFGLFTPGEYLYLDPQYRVKKDYCTVFSRLGTYPQATAYEFLSAQEHRADEAMNFLYTITSAQGQGIPVWMQMVDSRVRLRRREVDRLMQQLFDDGIYERIFRANREKRAF